ncbi:hypothetical protein [Scrofimicrobium sp. R131]|uniref:Molybdopterin synthase sulfur carrier subunit n=1 Tax=Scrofimicrobium appendicitidis TaxID=3079930 RepID=A0AAU7V4P7_9ACTO
MATVNVRYYAGMVDRAGTERESYQADGLAQLKDEVVARHGDGIAQPLSACSFLQGGQVVSGDATWSGDAIELEVLPPFAGG